MRMKQFFSLTFVITLFCLLYVHQQTEIFRLAYLGQKRQVICQELLDRNSVLRYNIGRRASLVQLGSKISDDAEFQMPDNYRLMKMAPAGQSAIGRQRIAKETMLTKIFSVKAQAEARTINP